MRNGPILNLCARITGHPEQYCLLAGAIGDTVDWTELVRQAERQGLGPLLHRHLVGAGIQLPADTERSLAVLVKIHEHQARVRQRVLQELLARFETEGMSPLVIKGAALCHSIYPDPALRPMRDIDLLFDPAEAPRAQQVARGMGFSPHGTPVPDDHYHLPPLKKAAAGMRVCLEIHRGLFPHCPPWYPPLDFTRLYRKSDKFSIGEVESRTLGREDTLDYLYQHGLHTPLSYESYKLIHVADLIGFVEHYGAELDWPRLRRERPHLCSALSMLHHVTPWDTQAAPSWLVQNAAKTGGGLDPRPFDGWPQQKFRHFKQKGTSLPRIFRRTFLPSRWWMHMYYGTVGPWSSLWSYCYRHPRQVWWWAKLYYSLPRSDGGDKRGWFGSCARMAALVKKIR